MQAIGKIGPVASLTLIQLWLEGEYKLTLRELETLEATVIRELTRFEDKLDREFGNPEEPDTVPTIE